MGNPSRFFPSPFEMAGCRVHDHHTPLFFDRMTAFKSVLFRTGRPLDGLPGLVWLSPQEKE
jgi:hypothetical protein